MILESDRLPKSDKLYVGIDQSLTNTAIAFLQYGHIILVQIKPKTKDVKRLAAIYYEFIEAIELKIIAGAAIEGYAMAANGRTFNLGEVGGLLRVALNDFHVNTIEVPPTVLKKVMTGKGNAKKEVIIKELYKNYGIDVDDNNDADAIALAICAFHYFEEPYHFLVSYRTEIQAKSKQIIGEHPNPLKLNEYSKVMGDKTVHEIEKARRDGKPKTPLKKKQVK